MCTALRTSLFDSTRLHVKVEGPEIEMKLINASVEKVVNLTECADLGLGHAKLRHDENTEAYDSPTNALPHISQVYHRARTLRIGEPMTRPAVRTRIGSQLIETRRAWLAF